MFLTTVINILLGLIFTWLVFSVAAMYVQEALAAFFHWRSRMLESTLRNMLTDAVLTDQFYNHPLIRALYTGKDNANKPSYIPASQFAHVLFDLVLAAPSEASLIQQQLYRLRWEIGRLHFWERKEAQKRLNLILALTRRALVSDAGQEAFGTAIETVRNEIYKFGNDYPKMQEAIKTALSTVKSQKDQIDALRAEEQSPEQDANKAKQIQRYRLGVAAMSIIHPRFKQTMRVLLSPLDEPDAQLESMLTRAQQATVDWFNSSMDRLSGWYKRRAQWVAGIIGIGLVLLFNTDSLYLANQLWRDTVLRDTLASQATQVASQTSADAPTAEQVYLLKGQFSGMNLPVGWFGSPIPLMQNGLIQGLDEKPHACGLLWLANEDIMGIPIAGQCYPIVNAPRTGDFPGWIMKLLGLAVTGLAVAQGAPFWFDILKKVINVRFSGANPVEAQKNVG